MGEAGSEEVRWGARRNAREVLELAYHLPLARVLSATELARAQERSWDPRIVDALARRGTYGLAEYLAAGPELLRDWESAWSANTDSLRPSHPRAAALIAAAIDIRRSGFTSPLPRRLLDEVHDQYLNERGGARLRPEQLHEAWAWATKPRRATTALLHEIDDDHVQVFDYLLDTVQRRASAGDRAPDSVLTVALEWSSPSDADGIASMAYDHSRYELANAAIQRAHRALEVDPGPEDRQTLAIRLFRVGVLRGTRPPGRGACRE